MPAGRRGQHHYMLEISRGSLSTSDTNPRIHTRGRPHMCTITLSITSAMLSIFGRAGAPPTGGGQ